MITNLSLIRRRRRPEYLVSLLAFALAAGGMACRDTSPITGPTAPLPPLPSGSLVVRGTVIEYLAVFPDQRPLAGVPLRVFAGGTVVEATSGADGSYEAQVPEVATEKINGLRDRYGILEPRTLAFFTVHATLDLEHSAHEREAIRRTTATDADAEAAMTATQKALDAWWGFLDAVNV